MVIKGRNSVMIGIRVSEAVNTILEEMAAKKGVTVSSLIKGKVEEYARLATQTVNTVNKEYVVIGGQRFLKPDCGLASNLSTSKNNNNIPNHH